jgi:hypothetical protein
LNLIKWEKQKKSKTVISEEHLENIKSKQQFTLNDIVSQIGSA